MSSPACPRCGLKVPVMRTQWNLGRTFSCRRCSAALSVSRFRSTAIAGAMLIMFLLVRPSVPEGMARFGLFLLFLAIGAPLSYFLSQVQFAAASKASDAG